MRSADASVEESAVNPAMSAYSTAMPLWTCAGTPTPERSSSTVSAGKRFWSSARASRDAASTASSEARCARSEPSAAYATTVMKTRKMNRDANTIAAASPVTAGMFVEDELDAPPATKMNTTITASKSIDTTAKDTECQKGIFEMLSERL